MAKLIESGHAKNVANSFQMNSYIRSYGSKYNPSKSSITLIALEILSAGADKAVKTVSMLHAGFSNLVAARKDAFKPLSRFTTRILNALKSSNTTSQVDDLAKSLVRKIQGIRASPKLSETEKNALAEQGKSTNEISASQLSFDNRLHHLDQLIVLLADIPDYAPNEEDLKLTSIRAMYDDLYAKNKAVVDAAVALSNARIERNEIMYKPLTGLIDISFDVKTYVKSVFGATSPQYKQLAALKFKTANTKQ